jgi:ribosomal protein L29
MTNVDLETKLREAKEALFNLRFPGRDGQLESPRTAAHGPSADIARILHRGA